MEAFQAIQDELVRDVKDLKQLLLVPSGNLTVPTRVVTLREQFTTRLT